jgi:uncharacterized membrane protein YheB (UPF0754 family)
LHPSNAAGEAVDELVFQFLGRDVTVGTLLIPVFAGVIGFGTNWVAIKMMFGPLEWWGPKLPFKLGFGKYKVPLLGWQGVIPSRAAKMGSLAVDTGLAKLGTMYEFYQALDPDAVAAHIVATSGDEVQRIVDDILEREYPELWAAAPEAVKRLVHQRVEQQMPSLVREVLDGIGRNLDRLVDLKLMVVRHLEANPRLLNQIFQDVGAKEFRFIIQSGGWLGFLLGFVPMIVWIFLPAWWTVPVGAALVGYLTNFIALKVIFQPVEPTRVGPIKLHGLFLRRQSEVAEAYADVIAYRVVTLPNIANAMLQGPGADRTRRLITETIKPVVDDAAGVAKPLVRAAAGGRYDSIRDQVTAAALDSTTASLLDEQYARVQAKGMQELLASRMKVLSYPEFSQMLRSAFEQDAWLLIFVGAMLGFGAGVLQVFVTLGGLA